MLLAGQHQVLVHLVTQGDDVVLDAQVRDELQLGPCEDLACGGSGRGQGAVEGWCMRRWCLQGGECVGWGEVGSC